MKTQIERTDKNIQSKSLPSNWLLFVLLVFVFLLFVSFVGMMSSIDGRLLFGIIIGTSIIVFGTFSLYFLNRID